MRLTCSSYVECMKRKNGFPKWNSSFFYAGRERCQTKFDLDLRCMRDKREKRMYAWGGYDASLLVTTKSRNGWSSLCVGWNFDSQAKRKEVMRTDIKFSITSYAERENGYQSEGKTQHKKRWDLKFKQQQEKIIHFAATFYPFPFVSFFRWKTFCPGNLWWLRSTRNGWQKMHSLSLTSLSLVLRPVRVEFLWSKCVLCKYVTDCCENSIPTAKEKGFEEEGKNIFPHDVPSGLFFTQCGMSESRIHSFTRSIDWLQISSCELEIFLSSFFLSVPWIAAMHEL